MARWGIRTNSPRTIISQIKNDRVKPKKLRDFHQKDNNVGQRFRFNDVRRGVDKNPVHARGELASFAETVNMRKDKKLVL